ncbi:hypothetical protein D3H55_22790 [Bacillus salacetis]|uniref:Uncharacterized protein n=1 Tax=Bacillus salacetis TaxID=2315464 RepID=A0A3A1QM19_9BACI|nr:hypothetical protein [Bacillus salacetis]RIW27619.1 hypothetical protein D3H55_22790 [Bacillus salacetis]
MNNSILEKASQQPDFTLYPKLFSAVKNVENAVRLLSHDNMILLQSANYFSTVPSILSIRPLKILLENSTLKSNFDFYLTISNHLDQYERCMELLWKEKDLRELIEEIYFLIHQAYMELDKADIQTLTNKITSENEVFEDYLRSQIG